MINLVHLKDPDCFVHSNGTVWSYGFHHGSKKKTFHKLKPRVHKGYYTLHIAHKNISLHRLLAMAFIPNPGNLPVIDHINRNPLDNRLSNLRWSSISDNNKNRSTELSGCISTKYSEDIQQYRKEYRSLSGKHRLMMRDKNNKITQSGNLTPEEYELLKPLSQRDRYNLYHSWGKRKRHKLLSSFQK